MIPGNKILRIQLLKFMGLLTFMLCISLNGAFAQDHQALLVDLSGQKLSAMHDYNASSHKLMKIIHLDGGKKSLREVLQNIADQAGLKLSYSEQLIPLTKKVHVKQAKVTTEQALWSVLKGTSLRFGVSATGQLFFFEVQRGNSVIQQETVTGMVTDASTGEPLPGVNVVVKGTTTGTSTDGEGKYKLNVSSLSDTLVFSFIGYQTREVPVNGRLKIDIALQPKSISGSEVIVVGYGTQRKSDVTGAVSSVSKDKIDNMASTSVTQFLQGSIPGLNVTNTAAGADPGSGVNLLIRGRNSISASNSPLIVLDGAPYYK